MQEDRTLGRILRYKYPAVQKRIRLMFAKAKLEKPCDFYNLRHSAVVLSKKDNVPPELASEKFGHTIEYYVHTYGRLDETDILERYESHYGITKESETLQQNIKCRCGAILEPGTEICSSCGNPVSLGKALDMKSETEKRLEEIERKMIVIEKFETFTKQQGGLK